MQKRGTRLLCLMVFALVLLAQGVITAQAEDAYKVYFNYNYRGAPEADAQMVQAGDTLERPADPTREGYRFEGWSPNVVGNRVYDFDAPVDGDMRLFAIWTPTRVTVTFDPQGEGAQQIEQTVAVGEKAVPPQEPAREGYEFGGWYINAAGTRPFDFDEAPARDVTVYAKWTQEQATITYVLYGEEEISLKADFGQPLARPQDPTREDYAFEDWYTAVAGADKFDFDAPVTEDTRIFAHWTQTVATVTFDANYDGGERTSGKAAIGEALSDLPTPEREGYTFGAWYADAAATQAYDPSAPVTQDITLYAGWTLETYTVTFLGNYADGGSAQQSVSFGQAVTAPEDPTREGYDFTGWYVDESATTLFDAGSAITGDMTVYAGWQSREEASGERVYTYMLNYGEEGVYETQTYTSTRRVKEPDAPMRAGYFFAGWAKEPEGTTLYDFSSERSTRSVTLYAKWLKGYRFEAEYTFMDGKPGQGSSDNCMGTDIIQSPKDVAGNGTEMGMSNGYYVGKLYYNGAFLEFDITSSAEVSDAALVMRLTPDLFDMRFTDETWQVIVNDERIAYGRLNLTGAIAQTDFDELGNAINGDMNKRPFENYVITTTLHLQEGDNHIRLVTNNKEDHGGTFNAETPLIDCMYIYADAELKWTRCYPENVGQSMEDVRYDVTYDTGA